MAEVARDGGMEKRKCTEGESVQTVSKLRDERLSCCLAWRETCK